MVKLLRKKLRSTFSLKLCPKVVRNQIKKAAHEPYLYLFSSSAVRDKAAFHRGVKRLTQIGHEVEVDEAALSSHMRFAGDDACRIAAIHRAAASGADVAMAARGGYGLTRILPGIRYKAIAKAIERGMKWVGDSDVTALQMALIAQLGVGDSTVTWAGPNLVADFGAKSPDDIMEDCFADMVSGVGEGTGWRLPSLEPEAALKAIFPRLKSVFEVENAPLWGSNLCVFTALLGTPYFPKIEGGVLFFEDVAEHPYRIERMLTQLLHAGVLAKQKAIVLGQFSHYKLFPNDKGFKIQTVVDWLRAALKSARVPVFTGLPFGHVATKVSLPVGARVTFNVENRDAFLLWGKPHEHAA